jgi:phage gp16-like protein
MKLPFFPVLAAAVLGLAAAPVRATPLEDRVSQLKHAIEKEAAARAADNGANGGGFRNPGLTPAVIDAGIDQMVGQMDNPAMGQNIDAQLSQITQMFNSDEVQETAKNLLAEIHQEQKDRAQAEATELKALIQRVSDKVTQATKPEELDGVIADLQKHQGNRNGAGAAQNQALYQQATAALEFVKKWQDYLSHTATGQTELARQDVESLTQNNTSADFVPRSKLLALAAPGRITATSGKPDAAPPVSPVQAITDGIKTLDDLALALTKLAPLRTNNGEAQNAYNSIDQMLQSYRNLKAGLPPQYNVGYGNNNSIIPASVRTEFLLLALQARFETYKGAPPGAAEKPVDYVNRVIADALGREDWTLLQNALQVRAYLEQNQGLGFTVIDANGIGSLIAASHQEAAGQYALAVASYETALKSSGDAVPAKVIGEKLAAIQRDHPKEYADGMQITISPPAPRRYEASVPGMPGGIPGHPPATNVPTAPLPPTLQSAPANPNAAAAGE